MPQRGSRAHDDRGQEPASDAPDGKRARRPRVTLPADPSGSTHRRITPRAPRRTLRCVSSGYLADGCSCRETIPGEVLETAWADERDRDGEGDRFFRVAWRGGIWLAYGLADGSVRGVYCPEHSAERDERSATAVPVAGAAGATLATA